MFIAWSRRRVNSFFVISAVSCFSTCPRLSRISEDGTDNIAIGSYLLYDHQERCSWNGTESREVGGFVG